MRVSRLSAVCLGFVLLFVLEGCTTTVSGMRRDPTFTYAALKQSKLAVGGITTSKGELFGKEQASVRQNVARQIAQVRPDLKVDKSATVRRRLSSAAFDKLLAEYAALGGLSYPHLEMLRKKLGRSQYLLFANIEADRTRFAVKPTRAKEVNGVITPALVVTSAERTLKVRVQVYDLRMARMVWTGTIRQGTKKERRHIREDAIATQGKKADQMKQPKTYAYPESPTIDDALAGVFKTVAQHMPAPFKK
jgi:hypothetical protein